MPESKFGWYFSQEDNAGTQALWDLGLYGKALAESMEVAGIRIRWLCDGCAEDMVFMSREPQTILPCQHCME